MSEETDRLEKLLRELVAKLSAEDMQSASVSSSELGDLLTKAMEIVGDARTSDLLGSNAAYTDPTRDLTNLTEPTPGLQSTQHWQEFVGGTQIGQRYQIIQKLGEGGMGQVWLANQSNPVKRKVAIKLIKTGMDSKAVLSRFEQERQALAMMDHPNIAKVLDAGVTEQGNPYFVMELVNGTALTKFCDTNKFTPKQRLELFIPICHAVQHAHQKGIVHRDLKPANILVAMVDGNPTPKIIDFGVAKATGGKITDSSMSTQLGAIIGTLEYMSPEQAGLSTEDIDTRSDIYSLGVILYELLTGLRPFDSNRLQKALLAELHRIIHEEVPSKPSTRVSSAEGADSLALCRMTEPKKLAAMLRGELDWIVMKCLEKSRDRRYETANALCRDLQRFLADEPIEARPPSFGYLAGKFLQRNKAAAGATLLIAVCLILGVIGTTLGRWEAQAQRDVAKLALEDEAKQRQEADRQRLSAEAAAEAERLAREQEQKRLQQVLKSNTALASIFKVLNPFEKADDDQPLNIVLGEQLVQVTNDLEAGTLGDPVAIAGLQVTLGKALYYLGYPQEALRLFRTAVGIYDSNRLLDSTDGGEARSNLAATYRETIGPSEALPLLEAELQGRTKRLGPNDESIATVLEQMGLCYRDLDKHKQAMELHQEALRIRTAKLGEDHPRTLNSQSNLAEAYSLLGKTELALPLFERASIERPNANDFDSLERMSSLASQYLQNQEGKKALEIYQSIFNRRKELLGASHPGTLRSMYSVANSLRDLGETDSAISLTQELNQLVQKRFGQKHPQTLDAKFLLALLLNEKEQFDTAIPMIEQACNSQKLLSGEKSKASLKYMVSLARTYSDAGRHAEGIELQKETLHNLSQTYGANHREALASKNQLAVQYSMASKLDDALTTARELVETSEKVLGSKHADTLVYTSNLAGFLSDSQGPLAAIEVLQSLIHRKREQYGNEHVSTISSLSDLAFAFDRAKQPDKALDIYEEVYRLSIAALGPDHLSTLTRANNLAYTYQETGDEPKARSLFQHLVDRYSVIREREGVNALDLQKRLANALSRLGRHEEANQLHKARIQHLSSTAGPEAPVTLTAMNAYARGLTVAREYAEALNVFQKVFKGRKEALGKEHYDTLLAMNNLAIAFDNLERSAEAIPIHREILRIRQRVLGHAHDETIETMRRLASSLEQDGKIEESLSYYLTALRLNTELFGAAARPSLSSMLDVAFVYCRMKRFDEAIKVLEPCLELTQNVFGVDHTRTIETKGLLGELYHQLRKLDEALPLLQESLAWREKNLGDSNRQTIASMTRLASFYDDVGKPLIAEQYYERALRNLKQLLGPKHRGVIAIMNDYSLVYREVGKVRECIAMTEETYRLSTEVNGPNALPTTQAMYHLVSLYRDNGKPEESFQILKKLVSLRAQIEDKNLSTACLAMYGLRLLEREQWSDAEPIIRECLAIREGADPSNWTTSNTRSMLGGSLLGQKKYVEAKSFLEQGYAELVEHLKSTSVLRLREAIHQRTRDCVGWLIKLCDETNDTGQKEKWTKILSELNEEFKESK